MRHSSSSARVAARVGLKFRVKKVDVRWLSSPAHPGHHTLSSLLLLLAALAALAPRRLPPLALAIPVAISAALPISAISALAVTVTRAIAAAAVTVAAAAVTVAAAAVAVAITAVTVTVAVTIAVALSVAVPIAVPITRLWLPLLALALVPVASRSPRASTRLRPARRRRVARRPPRVARGCRSCRSCRLGLGRLGPVALLERLATRRLRRHGPLDLGALLTQLLEHARRLCLLQPNLLAPVGEAGGERRAARRPILTLTPLGGGLGRVPVCARRRSPGRCARAGAPLGGRAIPRGHGLPGVGGVLHERRACVR